MQWEDDVSNDDIEAVNASSTTKIQYSSTSLEAYKPHIMHVIEKEEKDKEKMEEVSDGWLKKT